MGRGSLLRRFGFGAFLATAFALAISATASADTATYQFLSYRGVNCTLKTNDSLTGTGVNRSIAFGSRIDCNRPVNHVTLLSRLWSGNSVVRSDYDECTDPQTCGKTDPAITSSRFFTQSKGIFEHEAKFSIRLNAIAGGIDNPTDPKSDWWIAADARVQCLPTYGRWGYQIDCQNVEYVAAL